MPRGHYDRSKMKSRQSRKNEKIDYKSAYETEHKNNRILEEELSIAQTALNRLQNQRDDFKALAHADNYKSPANQRVETPQKFDNGFSRVVVKEAFHLICPEFERRVSLICSEGLAKHKDTKVSEAETTTARHGGPLDNLIRHAKRHFNKWLAGDRSEDHLAKLGWALQQIMHQETFSGDGINIISDSQLQGCQHYNMFLKPENRKNS